MSDKDGKKPNLRSVAKSLNDAAENAEGGGLGGDAEPPRAGPDGREPGEIWPGCPVAALGKEGGTHWYLDMVGQLRGVTNHQKDTISDLFGGRTDLLTNHYPTRNRQGAISGWDQERSRSAMHRACAEKGVWNAAQRVRGTGAWRDADGELVLHCGDQLLVKGEWRRCGEVDGYVYPTRPKQPRPTAKPEEEHVAELTTMLCTWRWTRGDLDAVLLLGWIGCAMFSGALDWRPMMWISGDKGTGKSTLHRLIHGLMGGDGAMVSTANTTAAGIYQALGQDALPVAIDELEPSDDPRKDRARDIIQLARQAASGAVAYRGGADHTGRDFVLRSCFLFSSILVPPLLDQDVSRIALLELLPLDPGAPVPTATPRQLGVMGRSLRTLIARQWGRWDETLETYRRALAAHGHAARGADQFGTLLAMADMLGEVDAPDVARADRWAKQIAAKTLDDTAEQLADWQRCASYLMGQLPEAWSKGSRWSVAQLVRAVAGYTPEEDPTPDHARDKLDAVGIKVKAKRERAMMAISTNHPQLAKLFEGSHWQTGPGQTGVWAQSIRRAPGAKPGGTLRFAGHASKTVRVPLIHLMGEAEDDNAGQG